MGEWLRIKKAAAYADVSARTIRRWFDDGLKHSRVRGVPFTSEQWIDEFIEGKSSSESKIDAMVDDVVRGMK